MSANIRKKFLAIILLTLTLILCSCMTIAESNIRSSNNDSSVEILAYNTAIPTVASEEMIKALEDKQTVPPMPAIYTDSFTNSTDNMGFTVSLESPTTGAALPVIQVRPKEITSDQAMTVAHALFGDAELYEYSTVRSKSEIEQVIYDFRQTISDRAALVNYYGGDEEIADATIAQYEARITALESEYENSPDVVEQQLCAWEFYPESHYTDTAIGMIPDDRNQYIKATVTKNGIPYLFFVCNRDQEDYSIHNIIVGIDDSKDTQVVTSSTDIPTEKELEETKSLAEKILLDMDMGDWIIDSCEVETVWIAENVPSYRITVIACPVYNGIKVTYRSQLTNLKTDTDNYYYENVILTFNEKNLVSFIYTSPLEIVNVINENADVLSIENTLDKYKEYMQLQKPSKFGIADFVKYEASYSTCACLNTEITHVELGLTRIEVEDNEKDYYLIPTYTFYGTVTAYDSTHQPIDRIDVYSADNTLISGFLIPDAVVELVTINAENGSVIHQFGY